MRGQDLFLEANGLNIRNGHGSGDVVPLRGVNLGGWLVMEGWMTPMDSTGLLPDDHSVLQTLDIRFGVATEQSLIQTYQNTWITTNDLDNIRAMGMNLVRLPVWWGDFETLSGAWRSDAFNQMDWLITNAWQRGLYTIIDLHGVPGGQSTDQSTGWENQNQYWTNGGDQSQTVLIWQNIASHYAGNPAVAGYDLINEPQGTPNSTAVWSAYDALYQAIRAIDPDHIIFIQGTWGNWDWSMLPAPGYYGWSNIVYEMHEYQWTSSTNAAAIMAGVDNQVSDFKNHQSWNVPAYIGEFNEFSAGPNPTGVWEYAVQQFDTNQMNWSAWTYKAIAGGVPNNWGLYDPVGTWPAIPNILSNSVSTISNRWSRWNTPAAFGINPELQRALGAPQAIADSYTATSGAPLVVGSNAGVLANDLDINAGSPGIELAASLVSGPAYGQLTLNPDGSFSYTAPPGFDGTDTFRYAVSDGYVSAVDFGVVTVQVGLPIYPAGWSDADIGSPGVFGGAQYNPTTDVWTVSGGGSDIWGTNDQCNFVSENFSGDISIIAQVMSLQDTDPWAKAGVMFRNDDSADATFADVVVTPGNGVNFQWRSDSGGACIGAEVTGVTPPVWVMLTRSGDSFTGFYSLDGNIWVQIGTAETVNMGTPALAGLVVTAHNNADLNTATFANVSDASPPPTPFQQWQIKYFGSTTTNAAAADADPDGDGFSNLQEYLAGTDPTDAASYFHVTSLLPETNGVLIAWMCGAGTTNAVQIASTPAGPYSTISPNIILTGSGTVTTNYFDATALSAVVTTGTDNASGPAYTGGNFNGISSGSGLGAWALSPATNSPSANWFIGTSTNNGNGSSGGIDSAGNVSWGSFANNGATATAVRVFLGGNLTAGQTFAIDMDNGYIESGDSVGFDLQNSSGQTLVEISYVGFNAAGSYGSVDATGAHSLGVPYTADGLHVEITLASNAAYSVSLTPAGGSEVQTNGTLISPSGGQGISQIRLFNNNAAASNTGASWNAYWNNITVTTAQSPLSRIYRVLLVQ